MKCNVMYLFSLFFICSVLVLYPEGYALGALEKKDDLDVKTLSQKPIEITAEELVAERNKQRVIFKGDVIARQNGLVIYSDSLIAEYDDDKRTIARIEADGNVRVVQEGIREAQGDRAIFLNKDQTVELMGNTVVSEGDSKLMGERLILFIAENRSVIVGGKNGRVKAIINPQTFMENDREQQEK